MLEPIFQKFDHELLLRKSYHIIGGSLVLSVLLTLEPKMFLILGILVTVLLWSLGGGLSFALLGVLTLLAISGSKFSTAGGFLILIIGDWMAAILGEKFGRKTWPWNQGKTITGTVGFFLSATIAMYLYLQVVTPETAGLHKIVLALIPSIAGSMVETRPISIIGGRKPDDNLTVVLICGTLLHGLSLWLGVSANW
jgi:dolichol kinase